MKNSAKNIDWIRIVLLLLCIVLTVLLIVNSRKTSAENTYEEVFYDQFGGEHRVIYPVTPERAQRQGGAQSVSTAPSPDFGQVAVNQPVNEEGKTQVVWAKAKNGAYLTMDEDTYQEFVSGEKGK